MTDLRVSLVTLTGLRLPALMTAPFLSVSSRDECLNRGRSREDPRSPMTGCHQAAERSLSPPAGPPTLPYIRCPGLGFGPGLTSPASLVLRPSVWAELLPQRPGSSLQMSGRRPPLPPQSREPLPGGKNSPHSRAHTRTRVHSRPLACPRRGLQNRPRVIKTSGQGILGGTFFY